ncbi:hypothetical protein [Serratia sp. DD3]|uniref:hypothetical protein n=1 Tax=Serratia sp. DD3 TaxID=1410619 RepID=UPI0004D8A917|nr:hypothetical protein [Serratia sp. DD3]KEY59827.1 hypothetical protein SRDD_12370 [Serratia sp. DD3]
MKEININIDGESHLIITKDGKTALGVKGNTTPEADSKEQKVEVPNILIVTRKNADVLFVLKGGEGDLFKIVTAQELYDKFKYQWFEPLADDYRVLIYVNKAEDVKDAYKHFTWDDIVNFSLVDRPSISYYNKLEGDWKHNQNGGADYLLTMIDGIPYWTDAIGQIPFAFDTYREHKNIPATVETGITWGTGKGSDVILGNKDESNTYDNFFVLRGAIFASKKFSYSIEQTGKTYPPVIVREMAHSIDSKELGKVISTLEYERYAIWKK